MGGLSRQPSLRAIAAFEASARHQSFAAAAKELNLTQSAISHAVRSLETQLGARLFDRRGPYITLTRQGRDLVERTRLGMHLLAQALSRTASGGGPATLVIGCEPAFAQRVLLRRLAAARHMNLVAKVEIRTDLGSAAVQSGEADLCIATSDEVCPSLCARRLPPDSVFPVASPRLRAEAARFPDVDLIESTRHPWALWFSHAGTPGSVREPVLRVGDVGLAIAAAKAGLGVALASGLLAQDELERGELERVANGAMPARNPLQAIWRPTGEHVDLVAQMVDLLIEDPRQAA